MADSDIKFGIGAEDAGFNAQLEEAKVAALEAAEQIKAAFETINDSLERIQGGFAAFTAALAGGEAFKEMISSSVNATVESQSLGRQLGISATQASQLKVAFGAAHITQDQFTAANGKITQALKKNESAFTELGVATRDSNGNFRNSLEIQMDVNAALLKFKEGTDRNVEAAKIFGKSWLDAMATLRLTPEVMDESAKKADALGLTIGQEGAASVEQYRTAMNDVHEVIEALGRVISTALLPVLTDMGEWLGSHGTQLVEIFRTEIAHLGVVFGTIRDAAAALLSGLVDAFNSIGTAVLAVFGQDSAPVTAMEFFRNVLRTIESAFVIAGVVIRTAVEVIVGAIDLLSGELTRLGNVAQAVFKVLSGQGSWSDITAAWDAGTKAIEDKTAEHMAKVIDIATKGMEDVNKILTEDIGKAAIDKPTAAPKGGDGAHDGDEKKAQLLAELQAELEAKKAAWATEQAEHGTFIQFSLQQEQEFWESKRGLATAGSAAALTIERNISKLTVDIKKDEYKDQLAAMKADEQQYKSNLEAKLAIAQEIAAKVAKAEGSNSAAAKQAAGEVLSIERELAAQRLAEKTTNIKALSDLELSKVDAAEREAQLQNSLGRTTDAQLIAQEKEFEAQSYQLKLQALDAERALDAESYDKNPAKLAQLNAQKLALETQYAASIQKLNAKSVQDSNKDYAALFASIKSGFASTISDFMKGTTSLSGAIKGLFADIGQSIMKMISNMAAQFLETSLMQLVTSKTSGAAIIGTLAAQAAAGAFASTAAIPYVGPELAPAAAATAYASTMSFQGFASAAGGYDIPGSIDPVIQAHRNEMVLPAKYADVLRNMAAGGQSGGRTGGGHTIHIHAMDGQSVLRVLTRNSGQVSQALKKMNGRFMV
jgi:hypothetical protein